MSAVDRLTAERDAARADATRATVEAAFAGSGYVRDRFTVPAGMVQATFGERFRVEAGRVVGVDAAGNVIADRARLGEPAGFDDALAEMVAMSGFAGQITRCGMPTADTARSLSRFRFEALNAADRMAHIKAGGRVTNG